jgi:hypothetical protein
MINHNEIPTLNETTFQEFLLQNQKQMFVYETEDYDYHYYLPSHLAITESCTISKIWVRQIPFRCDDL